MSTHRSHGENSPSRGRRTESRATDRRQLKTVSKADRRAAEEKMRIALARLKKNQ